VKGRRWFFHRSLIGQSLSPRSLIGLSGRKRAT